MQFVFGDCDDVWRAVEYVEVFGEGEVFVCKGADVGVVDGEFVWCGCAGVRAYVDVVGG